VSHLVRYSNLPVIQSTILKITQIVMLDETQNISRKQANEPGVLDGWLIFVLLHG